jgi:sigma-B regulation protein RsbU (phosphoserine phosphatase)
VIAVDLRIGAAINCDRLRVGQLFSNLLGNALTYGATNTPVRVEAVTDDASFRLSVCNAGEPIPPAAMERLFLPFSRGNAGPSKQGLGLGLYIASEIAKGHNGTLRANSTAVETCFTFEMPLG